LRLEHAPVRAYYRYGIFGAVVDTRAFGSDAVVIAMSADDMLFFCHDIDFIGHLKWEMRMYCLP
jgi:hypothetical protein